MIRRLYTADELADTWHIRAGWIKRQAAQRKIPFTMLGGEYRFSEAHAEEIIRRFEQASRDQVAQPPKPRRTSKKNDVSPAPAAQPAPLRARPPQRRAS